MGPEVRHLHLASRDHAVSRRFYETYFGFGSIAYSRATIGPRRPVLRSSSGFQIYLEGASSDPLPAWFHFGFFVESDAVCRELYDRMQQDQVPIVRQLVSEPFTNYLVQVYFDPHAT
jgi:hypothetical protein